MKKKDNTTMNMQAKCPFMHMPKCYLQIPNKQLNLDICTCCILGRIEKHVFANKEHRGSNGTSLD